MWYKDKKDLEELLKPIEKVMPVVKKQYEEKYGAIGVTRFEMLHDRYVLTLQQVAPNTKWPEKPVSMRAIQLNKKGYVAMYDVSLNKNKPHLFMTFLSATKYLNFEGALKKIKAKHKDENKGELRVLDVPALNMEALWLHFKDGTDDKFACTAEYDPKEKELFTGPNFLAYLNLKKKALANMTDDMGA